MDYHTSDTCTYIELTGGKVPPVEFCKNGCEDCPYKNKNKETFDSSLIDDLTTQQIEKGR